MSEKVFLCVASVVLRGYTEKHGERPDAFFRQARSRAQLVLVGSESWGSSDWVKTVGNRE